MLTGFPEHRPTAASLKRDTVHEQASDPRLPMRSSRGPATPPTRVAAPDSPRRPARDIIDAVVDNMRKNLEPLKYSTLAPSRYTVYLHASEFARLEGIIPDPAGADDAGADRRAPEAESALARCGAGPTAGAASADPEIRNAAADWQVEFLADPDGDMDEGDLLIDSELILPASPDLGVGERTRRITTVHAGRATTTREQTVNRTETAPPAAGPRAHRVRRRRRPSLLRRRQGLDHDRPRRHRLPGRHPHRVVARRLARARAHPPGCRDRPVLPHRSELARHDAERPARAQGVRRGRRHQARERRRNARCRTRPGSVWRTRSSSSSERRDDDRAPAGPGWCFSALLVAVVGLYVWTGYQADRADGPLRPSGTRRAEGRRGK